MARRKDSKLDPYNEYVRDLDAARPIKAGRLAFWANALELVAVLLPITLFSVVLTGILYSFGFLFQHSGEPAMPSGGQTEAAPAEEACQVRLHVELNGLVMEEGGTYTVKPLDKITMSAWSEEADIQRIGYYTNLNMAIRDTFDNQAYITVPEQEPGTRVQLFIEAVAENDNGAPNTVTKTGWKTYILIYE